MFNSKIKRHKGRRLSNEQVAVAIVMIEAISNFSEDRSCSSWEMNIEHTLWDRTLKRKPDAYERSVQKLYAAAEMEQRDWVSRDDPFLAGLKTLAEHFQVWIYWEDEKTAIHIEDWKPLHEHWHQEKVKQRPPLEEVWKRIHWRFS